MVQAWLVSWATAATVAVHVEAMNSFIQAHQIPLISKQIVKSSEESWDWAKIKASRDLHWDACYDGKFDCARLDVPMDWIDPTDADRVILGVIRLKAKSNNGTTVPPVFINPGGPGGSGIAFMKSSGALIQTIVGDYHDVISFDPRGVGTSTPRVDCWQSATKQAAWSEGYIGGIDQWPGLAYDAFARGKAFSKVCQKSMNNSKLLSHLSTTTAARDMLEILQKSGHEKLRYWGFSYGTILGGVFAGLYPEKVDRLVSDGNVDYNDWFNLGYRNFLADADIIADAFDNSCYKVGESRCALWANTPRKIRERREHILEHVKKYPVAIAPSDADIPRFMTYSLLQIFTRGSFYAPVYKVTDLANVYAAIEKNDGMVYYNISSQPGPVIATQDVPIGQPRETFAEADAAFAVSCSDWLGRDDADSFLAYTQDLKETSKWFGGTSTFQRLACAGWPTTQKWHVTNKDFKTDTANPILFIGNMADIITPLQSARNNSAVFPSSGVLIQNSYGHSSLASPSTCTAKHVQSYFLDGKLPPKDTICEEDYHIFNFPGVEHIKSQDSLSSAILQLSMNWASG